MSRHTPIAQRMHDWPRKKRSVDAVEEQAHAAVVEYASKTVVNDEASDDALQSGRNGATGADEHPASETVVRKCEAVEVRVSLKESPVAVS